jgi:hypothetical protein
VKSDWFPQTLYTLERINPGFSKCAASNATLRRYAPVFHPNVYSDGTLCMDIIQDQWVGAALVTFFCSLQVVSLQKDLCVI